jgi:hypothetical protein
MTKALDVHDRISRVVRELAEINRALTPETSPQERLALLKLEHTATGAAIEALEQDERQKRWQGREVRKMTTTERAQFITDCGRRAFEEALAREYGP